MTRRKTILAPQVDIALQHYYHGASTEPAGYEIRFILWDLAEHGAGWFAENQRNIIDSLDDLHINPDYQDALDLLDVDPRLGAFQAIDFQALSAPDCAELCVSHCVSIDEGLIQEHMLFVRREGADYLLNGGYYSVGPDEDWPATWAEAEVEGVVEDPDFGWFEARVPAQPFEAAYASAVEFFRREKIEENAYKPSADSWLARTIHGEFTR
jgi:hypothetical protein